MKTDTSTQVSKGFFVVFSDEIIVVLSLLSSYIEWNMM